MRTIPRAPKMIGITITFMFHNLRYLAWSRYLSRSLLSFIIFFLQSFSNQFYMMVLPLNTNGSRSSLVSRNLLSIIDSLHSFSDHHLPQSLFQSQQLQLLSCYIPFQLSSNFQPIVYLSFVIIFILLSIETGKSNQCLLLKLFLVFWSELGDQFIFRNHKEFYTSHLLEKILVWLGFMTYQLLWVIKCQILFMHIY